MFHRIINWITNPFKSKKSKVSEEVPPFVFVPLTEEQKSEMRVGLINAVKEFKEKHKTDIESLPLSRISEELKEKIVNEVKADIKNQTEVTPITEEVSLPKKKKRSSNYKRKKKSADTQVTVNNKPSKK